MLRAGTCLSGAQPLSRSPGRVAAAFYDLLSRAGRISREHKHIISKERPA
jgi:hypothetical protein